ncbi:hypothetical protein VE03_04714 [Pseudogymnoascus sp. 23342-1-I1]|nr:hypothetical protein VE03_04714 [Pseudogymnoascus sp. 23342-1-I1]
MDVGIDVDVGAGVDVDDGADAAAGADAFSSPVPNAENKKSLDDTEENTPDVASHATDKGGPPTGKSEGVTKDKKTSATGPRRNKVTGSLRFKAGKKGGPADRPSLAAIRSRIAGSQQQHPDVSAE